jgi:CRP-like cAMP-binding protein
MEPKQQLFDYFSRYTKIDKAEFEEVMPFFKFKKVARQNVFLHAGEKNAHFYFVCKGLVRMYIQTPKDEVTTWLALEGTPAFEVYSFLSGQASLCFLEAMEDVEMLYISKTDLEKLYERIPDFNLVFRKIWEEVLVEGIPMFHAMQNSTAEERYLKLASHKALLQRVPLKHLASFIGVTPSTLSRIRARLK